MSGLVLCRCRLAKRQVIVDAPSGLSTVLEYEHCDRPCVESRCRLCAQVSRAVTPPA